MTFQESIHVLLDIWDSFWKLLTENEIFISNKVHLVIFHHPAKHVVLKT